MPGTNALACYEKAYLTAVKSFITLATGEKNVKKISTYDVSESVLSGVEVVAEVLHPGLGTLPPVGRKLVLRPML